MERLVAKLSIGFLDVCLDVLYNDGSPLSAFMMMMFSISFRSCMANSYDSLRFIWFLLVLPCWVGPGSSSSSTFLVKSSRKVRTVWWVSFGSHVELDLKIGLPMVSSQKWSPNLICLLKCLISLDNSVILIVLGVGTKFKLYPRSLMCFNEGLFWQVYYLCEGVGAESVGTSNYFAKALIVVKASFMKCCISSRFNFWLGPWWSWAPFAFFCCWSFLASLV